MIFFFFFFYLTKFLDLRKRSLVEDDDLLQYALQNNFIGYTSNVQSYPTGIRDSDHDPDLDRVSKQFFNSL